MEPVPLRVGVPANLSQKFKPFLTRNDPGWLTVSTPVCAGLDF